jgi:uncharacterized protein
MNAIARQTGCFSDAARHRILSVAGEPLFHADWLRAVFIHYEVDAECLQRAVPFELDLDAGRAYVSLVAFTMQGMRPCIGGKLGALLLKPIAGHGFLNVRAYVRHRDETGIYFLAEWLSNPLSVALGPRLFGLPYRRGRLEYEHRHETGLLEGTVLSGTGGDRLKYAAEIDPSAKFEPCDAGSRDEFLLERYTAFTEIGTHRRFFRIWHPPWPQTPIDVKVLDTSLLVESWPWFNHAEMIGANYSPGISKVWMGRPHRGMPC